MQHVVNLSFEFDDEKVKSIAESTVENEMDSIIKNIILDEIAPLGSSWMKNNFYGVQEKRERDWSGFLRKVDEITKSLIEEHMDDVIEAAASKLVESVRRTKAWKERYTIEMEKSDE